MKFPRPRSLNGLIMVGFSIVALPLLLAVIWALISLDRVAQQSEQLISTGTTAAENNRRLVEMTRDLERHWRQYQALQSPEQLGELNQDLRNLKQHLGILQPLANQAGATELLDAIGQRAHNIVRSVQQQQPDERLATANNADFVTQRNQVEQFTGMVVKFVADERTALQEKAHQARRISAWQVALLVPGTIVLVSFVIVLISRPLRQLDKAISQLGESGFSKPISVTGPTDLERLGRQLEWLRGRLLELAQEKNRFLRHMSHELKTPLANIREGTELLLDGSVGDLEAPQHEVADILRMNGLKLQQLIENLLSFSAWQAKSEVLTLSEFPLRALVISVARAQRLALKAAQIQLKLEVDDILVNADRDKMRVVLDNLLSNAIKFTPAGGFITIRAAAAKNSFTIDFGDTGPGIPERERAHVFDAFFQGSREQGGQVAGTGIGLSVVLECIQAHNGTIELVYSDEFEGAHFHIHVPQRQRIGQHKLVANG